MYKTVNSFGLSRMLQAQAARGPEASLRRIETSGALSARYTDMLSSKCCINTFEDLTGLKFGMKAAQGFLKYLGSIMSNSCWDRRLASSASWLDSGDLGLPFSRLTVELVHGPQKLRHPMLQKLLLADVGLGSTGWEAFVTR